MVLEELIDFVKEPKVLVVSGVVLLVLIAMVFLSPAKVPVGFVPSAASGQCPANTVLTAQGCACSEGFVPSADFQSCVKANNSVPQQQGGCPSNSSVNANGQCQCNVGFYLSNSNCVSLAQFCQQSFVGSTPKADGTGCECKAPLVLSPDGKSCVVFSGGTINTGNGAITGTPTTNGGVVGYISEGVTKITYPIVSFLSNGVSAIKSGIDSFTQIPSLVVSGIVKTAGSVGTVVSNGFSSVGNMVNGVVSNTGNVVQSGISTVGTAVTSVVQAGQNLVSSVGNTISNTGSGLVSTAQNTVSNLVSSGSNIVSGAVSNVSNAASGVVQTASNIGNSVVQAGQNLFNAATTCKSQGGYLFWC